MYIYIYYNTAALVSMSNQHERLLYKQTNRFNTPRLYLRFFK